ncbi:MAG: LamB/YcsF family protein [Limnochordales bacterium]|nr:5-oxoprolinase subunit PxpA [Limnochordales bacterium]
MRVAINCDLGEGFGRWDLGPDAELLELITAANIACGMHAGDPPRMAATVRLAAAKGVGIGAHPSYPDLQGFGRRYMDMAPEDVRDFVTYQVGALQAFARACGARVEHVKAHGALYNRAADDEATARAIVEGALQADPDLVIVVLAGSRLEQVARAMGARVACEAFADRGYDARGRLVSRREPGAVIHDPDAVAERVWTMLREGRVRTVTGQWVPVRADTICVHGDSPGAVDILRRLRQHLLDQGVQLVSIGQLA